MTAKGNLHLHPAAEGESHTEIAGSPAPVFAGSTGTPPHLPDQGTYPGCLRSG